MKDLQVTHVPDHLIEQLQERAAKNRRSVNNEIIGLLEKALQAEMNERFDAQELLAEAKKLRHHFNAPQPSLEQPRSAWPQR